MFAMKLLKGGLHYNGIVVVAIRNNEPQVHIVPHASGGESRRRPKNSDFDALEQCLGRFWAYIVGQDPSDSKSNWLHVDIFRFCFNSFEAYSPIDSSKMIGNSPKVSNFTRLFLKLNWFICN